VVRGADVGRINKFGNFWPFTPGNEIIFEGKIFIPPLSANQRKVPEVLGTHKLELGNGYLLHGTNEEGSIGEAVSHGCVRMYNEDVAQLYALVPIGTPVYIF
jgi:lipoprotein-anchoring transpeptidase ErfK/SrfK